MCVCVRVGCRGGDDGVPIGRKTGFCRVRYRRVERTKHDAPEGGRASRRGITARAKGKESGWGEGVSRGLSIDREVSFPHRPPGGSLSTAAPDRNTGRCPVGCTMKMSVWLSSARFPPTLLSLWTFSF